MTGNDQAQATSVPPATDPTARVADIASVRAIKRLQHLWGHLADAGQWREMAALFVPDGLWIDGDHRYAGSRAIADRLCASMGGADSARSPDRLNVRLFLSPVITLSDDGTSATGRWHEVSMTGTAGVRADWAGGIHVISYRRTADGWRIAAMHYHPQFAGPYDGGWRHVAPDVPMVPYHYTPDQVGHPFPDRESEEGLAGGDVALAAQRLVREAEAQNMAAALGFYLDRKLWDDVIDLFAPDGVVDIAGVGRFLGAEGIRDVLHRIGPPGLADGELNDRPQLMPIVSLAGDGLSARVRSYEIGMTGTHGGESFWSVAIQALDLRYAQGRWRIAALRRFPRMRASYADGWAMPLPAADIDGPAAAHGNASEIARADYPHHPAPLVEAIHPDRAPPPAVVVGTAPGEALILRAEAFDAVENISNAYGYYIDEFRWDEMADLFARDGWKELSYIGTYIGRERVRGSVKSRYGNAGRRAAFMAIHQKTQPYVTVAEDGRSARIRLRLFQFNSQAELPGSWISGVYENQAVREDGIWRLHGMDLEYIWLADYAGGWAAIVPGSSRRFAPQPADIAQYPPDAPLRGEAFAPFPAIAPLGFHFANPVSGRQPALLLPWSDGHHGAIATG